MDKFSKTTLREISNLNHYLTYCVTDEVTYNLQHMGEHEEKLDEIKGFVLSFVDAIDKKQYYGIGELYAKYKNGEIFLHTLLGYRRKEFGELLHSFRREYIEEAKGRLFAKTVSEMTGNELNEYLLLIGLLK